MTDPQLPREDPPGADAVGELAGIVGEAHVVTDPALMEQYVVDWARRWRGAAVAVVLLAGCGAAADPSAAPSAPTRAAEAPTVIPGTLSGRVTARKLRQAEAPR